jgi:hypothetical protein
MPKSDVSESGREVGDRRAELVSKNDTPKRGREDIGQLIKFVSCGEVGEMERE